MRKRIMRFIIRVVITCLIPTVLPFIVIREAWSMIKDVWTSPPLK
jgi:hypothetical protein